ncbi:MAG: hypothetical protein JXR52_02370 [Bacteroidales bacterium]|nr:hypothetical protein [Bacteroidales bacterium]
MKKQSLAKKELERLCLEEHILIERRDQISNAFFYLPNLEKIGIMIHDFDFLVEGAARGRAINEISKIEKYLFDNEGNPDAQYKYLASAYSSASMYIESKKDLLSDRRSENWKYLFINYFSLEDIYNYFHKVQPASTFFRPHKIYTDLVELNYYLKLMEYLRSQVMLVIPIDEEKEIPVKLDSIDLKLFFLHELGFLDMLQKRIREDFYNHAAKLLTTLLGEKPVQWKVISRKLKSLYIADDESILNNPDLQSKMKDIFFNYKIDLHD